MRREGNNPARYGACWYRIRTFHTKGWSAKFNGVRNDFVAHLAVVKAISDRLGLPFPRTAGARRQRPKVLAKYNALTMDIRLSPTPPRSGFCGRPQVSQQADHDEFLAQRRAGIGRLQQGCAQMFTREGSRQAQVSASDDTPTRLIAIGD